MFGSLAAGENDGKADRRLGAGLTEGIDGESNAKTGDRTKRGIGMRAGEKRSRVRESRGKEGKSRSASGVAVLFAAILLTACAVPSGTEAEASRRIPESQSMPEVLSMPESVFGSAVAGAQAEPSAEREEPPSTEKEDIGEAESQEEPSEEKKSEITLVMVGDILLHTPVAESGRLSEGGYDFSAVFAQLKEEISATDLALVNQEVIIGGEELGVTGYPSFNAPYELGDALAEAGFDVVLHATNHALDKKQKGILNCLAFWREKHPDMAVLGIHDSEESQQEIYVYEQEGIRIAILNYTYGTNGIPLPEGMPYAVDLLERERVTADLRRAEELADFVVVCPHWGTEYVLESTEAQREWAAFFAENGADLILGTHPHVIEEIAWVPKEGGTEAGSEGEQDKESALVYYSLGNFVNWTAGTGTGVANRMVGGMAEVTVGLNEEGRAVIMSYGVVPLVCHVEQGFGGVTVYPLDRYTEELAARNEIAAQDEGFSLEFCRKLAEQVFGELASRHVDL